ncbi:hypothetical protein Tco_0077132 [Tanacetum coccineum]
MEMLSDAAILAAHTRKAMKANLLDLKSPHQTGGSSEGAGSKPEVPDESKAKSLDQESENKSWGNSEDDDDCKSDDERTQSDDDKSIDLNKPENEEESQGDEFVHTLDDYVPTDDETQDVDDEEYVGINEELYDDVNVEMKDAKPANEGKRDKEMTDDEKIDVEHKEINQKVQQDIPTSLATTIPPLTPPFIPTSQQSTPLPIPTTSTITTTEAPTSTSVNPESETLSALQHRVSNLEKEVK